MFHDAGNARGSCVGVSHLFCSHSQATPTLLCSLQKPTISNNHCKSTATNLSPIPIPHYSVSQYHKTLPSSLKHLPTPTPTPTVSDCSLHLLHTYKLHCLPSTSTIFTSPPMLATIFLLLSGMANLGFDSIRYVARSVSNVGDRQKWQEMVSLGLNFLGIIFTC